MDDATKPNRFDHLVVYVALLAAWIAMLGSLYFSEVAGYIPCTLCWYQRILMYPLAGVLAIGLLRRDQELPFLVLPFSLIGMAFSSYHYLLEKTDLFDKSAACTISAPCTTMWINWLGFITIPFLALVAFLIITLMMLIAFNKGLPDPDVEGTPWAAVLAIVGAVIVVFALLAYVNRSQPEVALSTIDHALELHAATTTPLSLAVVDEDAAANYDGSALYRESCAVCHGLDGEGVAGLGAALVASEILTTTSDAGMVALVRAGVPVDDPRNQTGVIMPPSGGRPDLSDAELLAIVTFLRQTNASD